MGLGSLTRRQWLLAIAALCVAGVVAALAGQYGFDMRPCPWCILQRLFFIVVALICLAAGAGRSPAAHRGAAAVTVVVSALGIAAALYQHYVAAKSSSCNLTLADKIITALHVDTIAPSLFEVTGSCAEAVVSMLGVPFDFWSLGLFLVVGAAAVAVLMRRG